MGEELLGVEEQYGLPDDVEVKQFCLYRAIGTDDYEEKNEQFTDKVNEFLEEHSVLDVTTETDIASGGTGSPMVLFNLWCIYGGDVEERMEDVQLAHKYYLRSGNSRRDLGDKMEEMEDDVNELFDEYVIYDVEFNAALKSDSIMQEAWVLYKEE